MTDNVEATLGGWRRAIDAELGRAAGGGALIPAGLREAVHYSATGEGKRMRGLLLMAAYDALGGETDPAPLAASIEIVHAYSLVHDDLPCMDNDSMRRGRPTTHRAYGVGVATLAGVAMVPLAVTQALTAARTMRLEDAVAARLVSVLMEAAGGSGMVGGQLMDLEGENRHLSATELERVHRAKTGALIAAAFRLGGIAANASPSSLQALTCAGDALGLAFQIADDVLDATSSSELLGKTAGHDVALAKSTYVSTLGVAAARARAEALVAEAMGALEARGLRTSILERLAHFIAARRS